MWGNRKAKRIQRTEIFASESRRYKYLGLPGEDCECVKLLLEQQTLGNWSSITAVEREPLVFQSINKWFIENKNKFKSYQCLPKSLHECIDLDKDYDLVFLDYLGNLTHEDAFWIRNTLSQCIVQDSCLAITLGKSVRNNKFVPKCINELRKKHNDLFRYYEKQVCETNFYKNDEIEFIAFYLLLLENYLFPRWDFAVRTLQHKEATSPCSMFTLKLTNFSAKKETPGKVLTTIESVIDSCRPRTISLNISNYVFSPVPVIVKESSMMKEIEASSVIDAMFNANSAGRKAYATKLQNAYVQQKQAEGKNPTQVVAALKAHVTRRRALA